MKVAMPNGIIALRIISKTGSQTGFNFKNKKMTKNNNSKDPRRMIHFMFIPGFTSAFIFCKSRPKHTNQKAALDGLPFGVYALKNGLKKRFHFSLHFSHGTFRNFLGAEDGGCRHSGTKTHHRRNRHSPHDFTPLPFTWYSGDLLQRINHPKNLNFRLLPPGAYGSHHWIQIIQSDSSSNKIG